MKHRSLSFGIVLTLLVQLFQCCYVSASDLSVVTENEYMPKRTLAESFNSGLVLAWQNPSADTLSDIKVYNITEGFEELLSDTISTEPSRTIMYEAEGLTVGADCIFRVDFSYTDRDDISWYFTGKPSKITEPAVSLATDKAVYFGSKKFGSWSSQIVNQTHKPTGNPATYFDRRMPLKYSLDNKISHGGEISIRFDSNAKDYNDSRKFMRLYALTDSNSVNLTANKTYKLTWWAKSDELTQFRMHFNYVAFDSMSTTMPIKGTTDWTYYEAFYTPKTTGATILRMMTDSLGTLWLDDIELYEWDKSADKAVGENLIADGDFENIATEPVYAEGLNIKSDMGCVTVSWTEAGENLAGFNIYEVNGDSYELRGRIPASGKIVKLPLALGAYNFALSPVDNYGIEGELSNAFTVRSMQDTTKYNIKSAFTAPFSSGLLLTWKNPSSNELESVKVYNVTNGAEEEVEGNITTDAAKYVLFPVEGLTNGMVYEFKVVFDFGQSGKKVYYFNGIPEEIKASDSTNSMQKSFGGWRAELVNQTLKGGEFEKRQPITYTLDDNVAHGEGTSMKFYANAKDYANASQFNRLYAQFNSPAVKLDSNSVYKLKYWVKSEDLTQLRMHMNWSYFKTGVDGAQAVPAKGTTDWTQYEAIYETSATENKTLTFMVAYTGILWLDDIELYKWDTEADEAIGENLIQQGDFENLSESNGTVEGLAAEDGENKITLKWNNVTGGCETLNLYEEIDGEYCSIGSISAKTGTFTFTNLPAGGYNYKIVPVNTEGLECTPVEISAQSIMPLYEIGNPVLTDENGNIVDKISDSGEYTISIPVKNNKLEDGMSVEIFASVCVENGLRKLYTNHKILSVNEADDMEITLEVTDSDTKIEFYVFDSREGMNVLYPYVAYTK